MNSPWATRIASQNNGITLSHSCSLPGALTALVSVLLGLLVLAPLPHAQAGPLSHVVRTVYPNGMVMLSKEVHAAPVVSLYVYYRVGSRNEVQGIFGISHQVEHMMFKGTQRLRPGDIDRLFSERGGENNAETDLDYTAYNETLPSSALEVALRVEADRMEHAAMDPAELAHEKTVVLSEAEGDLNDPGYKLDTAVTAAAFQAHPYHNPIIGYLDNIRKFSRSQVAQYYALHYTPSNAILVIVGDFNTLALRRAVGYYFAPNHPRPIGFHPITPEPPQAGERRLNVNGIGDSAYVEIAFHVPQTGHRDHYVMDVISSILAGGGRSSRLYRALVEKGLATEVVAGDPDTKDPFLMKINATVSKGHTQAEVETAIEAELDRLKEEYVSSQELQKTVNQVKADFVYRDDSVSSQAEELGRTATIVNYRYDDTYLDRIRSISALDIQQAARRYFNMENRTVGWFVPHPPAPGQLLPRPGRTGPIHYRWEPATHLSFGKRWMNPAGSPEGYLDLARLIGKHSHHKSGDEAPRRKKHHSEETPTHRRHSEDSSPRKRRIRAAEQRQAHLEKIHEAEASAARAHKERLAELRARHKTRVAELRAAHRHKVHAAEIRAARNHQLLAAQQKAYLEKLNREKVRLARQPPLRLVPPASSGHAAVLRRVLPNGMIVIVYPNHSNPDISISGSLRAGSLADPPGKPGVANFTAEMLSHGTRTRTEDEIASELDFVGSTVETMAGGSGTFFTGHTLSENLPLTLNILSDELQNPSFPASVYSRVQNEILTDIQVGKDDPATVAQQAFLAALYPEDYPLHWPTIGTEHTVPTITLQDLQAFHGRYYRPDLATIVLVGDVDPNTAISLVERYFGAWTDNGPTPTTVPPAMEDQVASTRVVKTMPDKTEAIIVMGFRGITRKDPDYYPAYLMNMILGNSDFNSRLMKNIRDRQGLVYGVSSSFDAGLVAGPWSVEMETNPANVDRAIASVMANTRQMQLGGATLEEINLFKRWVTGHQAIRLETSAGIAETLMLSQFYDLGMNYLWNYPALIRTVTPAQIQEAARRFLHPNNVVTSIAGPYPPGIRS